MALSKQTLQDLDSPRLRPLKIGSLSGLSTNQLQQYLQTEQAELTQLQNQIIQESTSNTQESYSSPAAISNSNLSERQRIIRQIQSVRQQKIAAAERLSEMRKINALKASDLNRIDKNLKKKKKNAEKEAKRVAKIEAKKDKYWEKGIRKGSVSGIRAHDRFKRFFDSKKWSDSDKDRMRELMNEVGVYEGDEVFKLLTLMSSGAFDSISEAEEFLNEYSNTQLGQETNIQKLREDTRWDYDKAKEGMEALQSKFADTGGPGLHMTF